ncbi:MAG: hypothetical protein LBE13_14600 [Bacteroidales bacterium]|jgi:hypothetical protein|nr:hypothetical protein [Bacteroidales bacterium]
MNKKERIIHKSSSKKEYGLIQIKKKNVKFDRKYQAGTTNKNYEIMLWCSILLIVYSLINNLIEAVRCTLKLYRG